MRFRKLRIAWSVFWGLAAVVLIVLWVRSYSWRDQLQGDAGDSFVSPFVIGSRGGRVQLTFGDTGQRPVPWKINHWQVPPKTYEPPSFVKQTFGFATLPTANGGRYFQVPHWPVVLMAAVFSAAPWTRWRFSLRTLLIATTLVAVVLGLIVWLNHH